MRSAARNWLQVWLQDWLDLWRWLGSDSPESHTFDE